MRAVVTGMIATYPVGGVVWDYGQYALGLERMGWEVYYLEDTGWQTYDPEKGEYGDDPSYGVRYLAESMDSLSKRLGRRWHFRAMDGTTYGVGSQELRDVIASADVLVNVSGGCLLRDEYMSCPRKLLLDTDPGWNHFVNYPKWDASPGWQGARSYREHDSFFTYAERLGSPDCALPDMGLPWKPTRPPVVMDCWSGKPPAQRWTTVMTWDNFRRPIVHNGVTYGTKEKEFAHVEDIPRRVRAPMQVAVGGDHAPRQRWREAGWNVVDSHAVSATPDVYRSYIESSRGEFSVAKNVYAATRCGWFSCRSVCYLASGRPVVLQDTGFSQVIPCGEGIVPFDGVDEAVAAVERVERSWERHCEAAREAARLHFEHERVLGRMLAEAGVA